MPTGNAKFDAAANEAGCAFLTAAGGQAAAVATYSLLTGQLLVGAGAAIATGLAAWAYASNCTWDPDGEPVNPGSQCGTVWKRSTPSDMYVFLYRFPPPTLPQVNNVQEVVASYPRDENIWVIEYISAGDGQTYEYTLNWQGTLGACADLRGNGDPEKDSPQNPPFIPPYTYTDPDDGCQITVNVEALAQNADGSVAPVFLMNPVAQQRDGAREGGGIIGGCNFSPTIYYPDTGGGGGGGTTIPYVPGGPGPDGKPPWLDPLIAALAGVAGNVVAEQLTRLFETQYAAGTREIYAACNYKEDGSPETFGVTYPVETYQERVLTSLDAIVDFQQQILLWRTPTCATSSPKVGDYRTISFISDEESPNGKSRLAKRFRYRSSSGVGLDGVVEHWRSFTWSSGPVCVQHRDSQLGAPQVWAASIDEGKRVIRHAAAEAGIDPDSVGRWEVSGSDNPRYGMPGTMRVNTAGGYYWITSRLGPDQRPPVALT